MRPEILFSLFREVDSLKGVGPRVAPLVRRVAGPLVRDVLMALPSGLVHRPHLPVAASLDGQVQTLVVTIERHIPSAKAGAPYKIRAWDDSGWLHLVYFKNYGDGLKTRLPVGARVAVSGRVERFGSEFQMPHPDYVVSADKVHTIPAVEAVYPATEGLSSRQFARLVVQALALMPDLPEWQDESWRRRQGWPGWAEALRTAHAPEAETALDPLSPARARLAYDELLAHQLALAQRRVARVKQPAPAITPGAASQRLIAGLPFSLTGSQATALAEIRSDLASGHRMARLLQGDVGSGKTAVAAAVLADAAGAGFQAALMAPTEILARQHFERVGPWLDAAGLSALCLTGRDRGQPRAAKLQALAEGTAQIAFGTHALFQDEVRFGRLALAVVDEQHRFGVAERNRLQAKGVDGQGVHLLTMSATPIPRTLELTQYGDLEVSRLTEKPPGRTPVTTRVLPASRLEEVIDRLGRVMDDGGQAYWVCPLVAESEAADLTAAEARHAELAARYPGRVGLVHGQMPAPERDAVMSRFVGGEIALLVATTVIEVGVDVPNAAIMVIEHAERFGLSQLHQLRGRVGRGSRTSACLLIYQPPLGEASRARLEVLRATEDGFVIAEQDWALRGGGDPLGLKQAGLPAYRLAQPIVHRDLLLAAADDARLILARDPDLSSERGQALRLLSALFDWRPERAGQGD